jgi:hypothetical protein
MVNQATTNLVVETVSINFDSSADAEQTLGRRKQSTGAVKPERRLRAPRLDAQQRQKSE